MWGWHPQRFRFANGAYFLRDVDSYRAPGDAATAADAARGTKLIDPGCQFVRHPLAVARFCGSPDTAAGDVGKIHVKARVPLAPSLSMLAGEIRNILDRRTEAGRADHRAIGTSQTTGRDVIPSRMLVIAVEQFFDVSGVHDAPHLLGGTLHDLLSGFLILRSRKSQQRGANIL